LSQSSVLSPRSSLLRWWWVVPALLLACWLGARALNADAIWNDEFFSLHDAGAPPYGPLSPGEIWERVATRNPWHTPGYFIALSGWASLVGWTPPMLRAFSLLVGLLGIAWTYRLGRDLVSPQVGVYAAAILSVSAFFIHYMHELRMYTLFVLLTAFTVWAYWRIVRGRPRPLHWVGLFLGALGMLYTHYFAALPLAAVGLWHVWLVVAPHMKRESVRAAGGLSPRLSQKPVSPLKGLENPVGGYASNPEAFQLTRKEWLGVPVVLALAFVCFLPWVGWLLKGLQMAVDSTDVHARALSGGEALVQLVTLFGNGSAAVMLIALLLAALALRVPSGRRVWFFAAAAVGAVLLTNAVLEIMHEGRVRYLISTWPLLAVLVGVGFARWEHIRGLRVPTLLLALWMAYGVVQSINPLFSAGMDGSDTFPMHEVAQSLRPLAAPDDVLVSYLPDGAPFWVYERNEDITQFYFNGVPLHYTTARTMQEPAEQPAEQQETLDAVGDSPRLWLAYEPARPASTMPNLLSALGESYLQCSVPIDRPNLRIELYARTAICCGQDANRPPLITYDGGDIELTAIDLLSPGDSLRVTAAWSVADAVPADTYSVALHVLDSTGSLVAQADAGLPTLAFACSSAHIDTRALPPDTYLVQTIVYRWQDGTRLAGTLVTGEQGDSLPIGTFEILQAWSEHFFQPFPVNGEGS
jgi:hypothetical protein